MRIIVNCQDHEVAGATLTYEQVCALASQKPERNPTCVYSAKLGGDARRDGSLWAGKSVELADGMRFECLVTGSA